MKRIMIAGILIFAMMFQAITVSAAKIGPLTEEAQIDDAGKDLKSSGNDGLLYKTDGLKKILCDENGNEFPDITFLSEEKLAEDIWILSRQGEELPEDCLVRTDGTILVDWALGVYKLKNEYFAEVIFGEEQTENKEEALMYVSANQFTIGFPGDDDVLFKGRKMLFDVKEGKLLEDVVLTDPSQDFEVVGSSYKVREGNGSSRILDTSGKVLAEDASSVYTMDPYYYQFADDKLVVYDDTLSQIAEGDRKDSVINGGFFTFTDEEYNYGIKSFDGNVIMEPKSYSVPRYQKGGLFIISTKPESGNTVYGLIDETGKEILETKYETIQEISDEGYIYAKETSDSEHMLLLAPDGTIISDQLTSTPNSTLGVEMADNKYLIIHTGEILDLDGKQMFSRVGYGLLTYRDSETDKYGLYELFDGNQLLKEEWDGIQTAYGKIYAYKDGKWHVFSYTSSEEV